ncbi:MAG TPA: M23 family metallopeptidase [Longimicrobiaceae bacterium]|nr:M23 family metallopeptidase [Longimicrobiaceae bacterium]
MKTRQALRLLICAMAISTGGCALMGSGPSPAERLANDLSGMIWPLPIDRAALVTSPYGVRGNRHHDGLDISGNGGDPIYAAQSGTVVFEGWMNGYGNAIIIDHGNGVTTLYGHASQLFVTDGQRVARGEVIGAVGATGNATGNHVHFEVAWAGVAIDPRQMLPALSFR